MATTRPSSELEASMRCEKTRPARLVASGTRRSRTSQRGHKLEGGSRGREGHTTSGSSTELPRARSLT
eukprot:751752-Hanusia_phi.AAC.3